MGDEAFMELPEERQDLLRHAVWAMVANAVSQSVRQFEQACNQLKIDPRFDEVGPDVIAMFAATPAVLGGVLFQLEDDPTRTKLTGGARGIGTPPGPRTALPGWAAR
jgi:hypothetical protein